MPGESARRNLDRRDFLKLAGTVSASLALQQVLPGVARNSGKQTSQPGVIIVLFDTMSARNLSVYGYPRQTTPNLERFAGRAVVFHSHYSAGNYTVPGTASLLTGMYPWTHRAFNQGGLIKREYEQRNFFALLGADYHRLAFSQNIWANSFLNQFEPALDDHLPPSSFSDAALLVGENFENDLNSAIRVLDTSLLTVENTPSSLLFGIAERLMYLRRLNGAQGRDYPRGLPSLVDFPLSYRLESLFGGLISECEKLDRLSLAYFHLWSPHEPYRPHARFANLFNEDDLEVVTKPDHPLGDHTPQDSLDRLRRRYDQYIANVDHEFGRLLDHLQETGALDRNYVIVTSDHGQLIERGVHGHTNAFLYEPLIHIPLLISVPGQSAPRDVYSRSGNIDVVPTLLHLAGQEIPDWCEGRVLPLLEDAVEDPQRSIFSMEAKSNPAFAPLREATIAMRKGPLKLISYLGYEGFEEAYELYDIESDPEELADLASAAPAELGRMKEELLDNLADANRPYERQ